MTNTNKKHKQSILSIRGPLYLQKTRSQDNTRPSNYRTKKWHWYVNSMFYSGVQLFLRLMHPVWGRVTTW